MARKRRGHGEGSITEVQDGKKWMARYWATLPDGSRKRRTIYGKSRKEAAEKLTQALAERNRNEGVISDDNLEFGTFLDQWLASIKSSVKPATLTTYSRTVNAHLKPDLGHRKLTKLGAHHLATYYQQRLDGGAKPATVRLSHAIIHRALGQAQKWNIVATNVADAVDPPVVRPPAIEPLTQEQVRTLLAASEGDVLEALWMLLLSAGLRIGEALATRWEDVDLDKGVLRVSRTLRWEKGGTPRYGTPKSGKGRSIHLADHAVEALKRHRTRQNSQRLAAVIWEDHGLVFTNATGGPLRRDAVHRRFQPVLHRAGLPPTTRLHDLRHTCATLLLSQGTHPTLVQHLLGHASVSMTLDRYSHWLPSMGEQTAAAMNAALGL